MCKIFTEKNFEKLLTIAAEQIENTYQYAESAASSIMKEYNYLQRKVEQWSEENLPKPMNDIVKQAFDALPFTLAFLFVPAPVLVLGVISGFTLSAMKVIDITQENKNRITNGIVFGSGIECIRDSLMFVVTKNPMTLVSALISGVTACLLYKAPDNLIPQND